METDPVRRMTRTIAEHVDDTRHQTGLDRLSGPVMAAMAAVPRDAFVPENLRHRAWDDTPLPIGRGQTISQPFIVALMTQLTEPRPDARVLEIGTGCGYAAAVLAQVFAEVHTVELEAELAARAGDQLARLGITNVHIHVGDGWQGWPGAAPYDAITVTCAPPEAPRTLIDQLAPGGRLVVPVGASGLAGQSLQQIRKRPDGGLDRRDILSVAFVPFRHPRPGA